MRKGQFQPGNPGGPGRPAKERKMMSLCITDSNPPPVPDGDCSADELINFNLDKTFYDAFGFWKHEVFLTQKQFDKLMDVFKAMKIVDKKATVSDAYAKLRPTFVAEAFADLEAAVKRGEKSLRSRCHISD